MSSLSQKYWKHSVLIVGLLLLCSLTLNSASAAQIVTVDQSERAFLNDLLSKGTTPLYIRATSIRESSLLSAMRTGSKTRPIRVLVDTLTPELRAIARASSVQLRVTSSKRRGRFGNKKLSQSFVLERGKGYYLHWYGALVWSKRRFRPTTEFITESGTRFDAVGPKNVRTFEQEFAAASSIGAK